MNNFKKVQITRYAAQKRLATLDKVSELLLGSQFASRKSFSSLLPLGIALSAGRNLFSILLSNSNEEIHTLFDGGQDKGPNINTHLKFIRDLFSASEYAIDMKISLAKAGFKKNFPTVSVVGINWLDMINSHIKQTKKNVLTEALRLINETLEALLSIGSILSVYNLDISKEAWKETLRHVVHIRDHFDYAETYLIDLLRPGEGKQKGSGSNIQHLR